MRLIREHGTRVHTEQGARVYPGLGYARDLGIPGLEYTPDPERSGTRYNYPGLGYTRVPGIPGTDGTRNQKEAKSQVLRVLPQPVQSLLRQKAAIRFQVGLRTKSGTRLRALSLLVLSLSTRS